MVRLRIRFTNSEESILMSQKFGKFQHPSKIGVQTMMNGGGMFLSSSPLVDFPFNMKTIERKFEPGNMVYLSYLQLYILSQALKRKLYEFRTPELYFYDNGKLCLNIEQAQRKIEKIPIKGALFELHFCIIQESTGGNNFSYYEGVRIYNKAHQTYAELTPDELSCFIKMIEDINLPEITMLATQFGLQLLQTPEVVYKALNISRN